MMSVTHTFKPFLLVAAVAIIGVSAITVYANEGRTSFWLLGQYGSLAAAQFEAGWSMPVVYYHSDVDAGGDKNFPQGGEIRLGLDVTIDLVLAISLMFLKPRYWAATEQTHIGSAGYYFVQVTSDSGDGALLGNFKSRVGGIGPQIGHLFAMCDKRAYVNLKGYWEFDTKHRPEGWNAWLTLSLPL